MPSSSKQDSAATDAWLAKLIENDGRAQPIQSISFIDAPGPALNHYLKVISLLPSLEYLDLTKCEVLTVQRDGRTIIESRNIGAPHITDRGVNHIVRMPKLRILVMGHATISDRACGVLCRVSTLETLALENTRITDKGLIQLATLKSLRLLDVRATDVTADGIQLFRRDRPDVKLLHSLPDDGR